MSTTTAHHCPLADMAMFTFTPTPTPPTYTAAPGPVPVQRRKLKAMERHAGATVTERSGMVWTSYGADARGMWHNDRNVIRDTDHLAKKLAREGRK